MTSPSFPVSLDALANPGSTTETDDAGFELDIVVSRLQNIAMALEQKLGIGASTPPGTAAVLRRTAAGASAWGPTLAGDYGPGSIGNADVAAAAAINYSKLNLSGFIVNADLAAGAAIATGKLAAGAAAGFKGIQYGTAQAVASTTFTGMTGSTLSINALGGPILFGVSLLDLGSSAAAAWGVQIWEASTPIVNVSAEQTPAGLYKTTSNMALVNGIAAGAHNYFLVWKASAGTMSASAICFWALEIKSPIQG